MLQDLKTNATMRTSDSSPIYETVIIDLTQISHKCENQPSDLIDASVRMASD